MLDQKGRTSREIVCARCGAGGIRGLPGSNLVHVDEVYVHAKEDVCRKVRLAWAAQKYARVVGKR